MTRVVVRALNPVGRMALRVHWEEEELFRKRIRRTPAFLRPKHVKDFLKTESSVIKNENGEIVQHIITDFAGATPELREDFEKVVRQAFIANGASADDFEVKFFDE